MHEACLVLAHGAGSCADFLSRAFPASACGLDTLYLDDRSGSAARTAEAIRSQVHQLRRSYPAVFVGGVSIGAHAAAMVAAEAGPGLLGGVVLALPAWTGDPPPGNPTGVAADEVAAVGASTVLRRLRADPELGRDWIVEELVLAWGDRPTLAGELRSAAVEPAPQAAQLGRISVPALVLGLDGDPVHPVALARQWSRWIPGADLAVVDRQAPAADRSVFGAAVGQWLAGLSAPR